MHILSIQVTAIVAVKPLWLFTFRRRNQQSVSMRRWFIRRLTQMVTKTKVFRPSGTMSSGRAYVLLLMYLLLFLFRHSFSELPRPIALKLCHMVGFWLNFIVPLQKFGRRSPKKFNMQNFGQFWTTPEFDCEYLRNG